MAASTHSRLRQTQYFKSTLIGLLILVPTCVIGLYLLIGSPQHLSTDTHTAHSPELDIAGLINRLETHLATNPDNAEGWFILGRLYLKLGRYDPAVQALTRAHEQNPTASTQVALADALNLQAQLDGVAETP